MVDGGVCLFVFVMDGGIDTYIYRGFIGYRICIDVLDIYVYGKQYLLY